MGAYVKYGSTKKTKHVFRNVLILLLVLAAAGAGTYFAVGKVSKPSVTEQIDSHLTFDGTVSESEKSQIQSLLQAQQAAIKGSVSASITTNLEATNTASIISVYVPVTNADSPKQSVSKTTLAATPPAIWHEIGETERAGIAKALNIDQGKFTTIESLDTLDKTSVALIPIAKLDHTVKLLRLDGAYYLDNFTSGGIIRTASLSGGNASELKLEGFEGIPKKDTTLTVNQTGVTALTRVMMRKLNEVSDPKYFSQKIGSFLSSADITHISNEVSFKDGCGFSMTSFCSDPRFIETLKDSGVDLVELTGNHNNDTGNQYNTETIDLYHSLGWKTIGGGLNREEASKYYVADLKGSKVAFLAYNYADSPGGYAITTATTAGANPFNLDTISKDIEKAKQEAQFVIVDVQYWECYSYPDGYVEFPTCDAPIGDQAATFKNLIDLGADMVVGTSAHQPQYYEHYSGKPIYYGLGNLYFDQTQWPGTERGIILTHYFSGGKLLQTKLSPTRFDEDLQTALMPESEAEGFLHRLQSAR